MSKQIKDKEVLMAILNVKKYAKNLRKKASNLQDPADDLNSGEAISSPSFFESRPQQDYMELNSPMLATKSSYNQSFETMARQKKQHSMTYLPGPKKLQRDQRKNSDFMMPEPSSPSKTYAPSRVNLSQSYKVQGTGFKSGQGVWKKQRKEPSQTFITLERKASKKDGESSSEANYPEFNRTITLPLNLNANKSRQPIQSTLKSQPEHPKLVQQLLQQINDLRSQICSYKQALVLLRTKYLQMEEKARFKVEADHLLDILRTKIEGLEGQKQDLNQVIKRQNEKIKSFEQAIVDIAGKFSSHYREEINRIISLETQNALYRRLLDMKMPAMPMPILDPNPAGNTEVKKQKIDDSNIASESESEGEGYRKPLQVMSGKVCKNEKDIQAKYEVKSILR